MAHQSSIVNTSVSNSYENISFDGFSVVCLGNFDGIHLGHRSVILTCLQEAERQHLKSIAFSFNPHPSEILSANPRKLISSYDERIQLLSRFGLDFLLMQKFDSQFSKLDSRYFVDEILVKRLRAKSVVVGREFHFGHRAAGSVADLRADGRFSVIECPPVAVDNVVVSSSTIRKSLELAQLAWARRALGYPYFVAGTVRTGARRGRDIGFPTANISPTKRLLIPHGVYSVMVWDEKANLFFSGMANWGVRPTFGQNQEQLEVFLFDFSDDLYSRRLRVYFLDFIRHEIKMAGIEDLKNQLNLDMQKVQLELGAQHLFHARDSQALWSLSFPDQKIQSYQPFV